MIKINLYILILLVFPVAGFSQSAVKKYGAGDNWYIQGYLGTALSFSESKPLKTNIADRMSPHMAFALGTDIGPYVSGRMQLEGWEAKTRLINNDGLFVNEKNGKSYHYNYFQANLDGILNLTGFFLKQEEKKMNFYGFFGIGYYHVIAKSSYGISTQNKFIPRMGAQGDYRITEKMSLIMEVAGNLMPDSFNGIEKKSPYDGMLNIMVGISYRFKTTSAVFYPETDPDFISELNDRINRQRRRIDELEKNEEQLLAALRVIPDTVEIIREIQSDCSIATNTIVTFDLNSYRLRKTEIAHIYLLANYLKENPEVTVTISGYADRETGNTVINKKLSEQRVTAVMNELTSKYNISPRRISMLAVGDHEQPFPVNDWNRVVFITVDEAVR